MSRSTGAERGCVTQKLPVVTASASRVCRGRGTPAKLLRMRGELGRNHPETDEDSVLLCDVNSAVSVDEQRFSYVRV